MRRVMVFGVFDGLHEGHRAFFRAAREQGDYLVVALAHDHIAHDMKGRRPKRNFDERSAEIIFEGLADEVVPGDETIGEYAVVKMHHPHVIALGYDQEELRRDLESASDRFPWEIEIVMMAPHEPDKFHSRLLNR